MSESGKRYRYVNGESVLVGRRGDGKGVISHLVLVDGDNVFGAFRSLPKKDWTEKEILPSLADLPNGSVISFGVDAESNTLYVKAGGIFFDTNLADSYHPDDLVQDGFEVLFSPEI